MTSSTPSRTFPRFSNLPSELRDEIWHAAIEQGTRIIEIKHYDYLRFRDHERLSEREAAMEESKYRHNTTTVDRRGILQACGRSRQLIKSSKYGLQRLNIGYNNVVFFIPSVDTIYFGPSSYVRNVSLLSYIKEVASN